MVEDLVLITENELRSEGGRMDLLISKMMAPYTLQQSDTCMPVIVRHRLLVERVINEKYPSAQGMLELKAGM